MSTFGAVLNSGDPLVTRGPAYEADSHPMDPMRYGGEAERGELGFELWQWRGSTRIHVVFRHWVGAAPRLEEAWRAFISFRDATLLGEGLHRVPIAGREMRLVDARDRRDLLVWLDYALEQGLTL